jgi:hypothetical protein
VTGGAAGARRLDRATVLGCGSHSSHLGRYQFQSPRTFIDAGSRIARTTVASIRMAAASDAELLENEHLERGEHREDADHHDRGAGDNAAVVLIPW